MTRFTCPGCGVTCEGDDTDDQADPQALALCGAPDPWRRPLVMAEVCDECFASMLMLRRTATLAETRASTTRMTVHHRRILARQADERDARIRALAAMRL